MTQIETITITISISALLTSAITLYFTFFYKRTSLICMLVQCNYDEKGDHDCSLEYSLSNTGNQEIVLKGIYIVTDDSDYGPKDDVCGKLIPHDCANTPCIIKPSEIKLIKILYSSNDFTKAIDDGQQGYMTFELVSSLSKSYTLNHKITHLQELNTEAYNSAWKPFALDKPYN